MNDFFLELGNIYKDTPREWKTEVIEKARKRGMHINVNDNLNFLYDYCLYSLLTKTCRPLINLSKKLGYDKPPCRVCRLIIKHWGEKDDIIWTPETAHLFDVEADKELLNQPQ